MTKSIEGLLRNHQEAEKLRRDGKPIWSNTIHLGPYYVVDNDIAQDDTYTKIGKAIAQYLRGEHCVKKHLEDGDDFELADLLYALDNISAWKDDDGVVVTAADELAQHIDELYDWCDTNRVWVDTIKFRPSKDEFAIRWGIANTDVCTTADSSTISDNNPTGTKVVKRCPKL